MVEKNSNALACQAGRDAQKRKHDLHGDHGQDLATRLREAGLRPTRQRLAIAALLLDGRHRHVSPEQLTTEIADAGTHVAGATVYNTLNQFTKAGLLRRITLHNEHSIFDTNVDHHHHFYDADHDQLTDIASNDVILAHLPQAPEGHEISSVDVVISITAK
ncbi:transcriptional repressor [Alphaproteobacteria bacterium]|jgi:Fur family iron response transcriptional regulator|nr:transcriptional repressor [Alphaproteobacteria bacterium]